MQQISDIRELKKRQYLLYIIIMLVLFVVMLVYTLVWCINYNKQYGFFVKTEAVVIEHRTEEGQMYDVLEYYVDDVVFLNTSSYLSKNNVGDTITIYYDSTNPSGFVTRLDNRRIVLPIITTAYGVVSAILTVMFFMTFYRKANTMQTEKHSPNIGNNKDTNVIKKTEQIKTKKLEEDSKVERTNARVSNTLVKSNDKKNNNSTQKNKKAQK